MDKLKDILKTALFLILTVVSCVVLSTCSVPLTTKPSTEEKIAEIVQEAFIDIDQFPSEGRSLSLDDAEAVLYSWAEGEEVTDAELKEAINVVLKSTDMIRDLISSIDEINLDLYS